MNFGMIIFLIVIALCAIWVAWWIVSDISDQRTERKERLERLSDLEKIIQKYSYLSDSKGEKTMETCRERLKREYPSKVSVRFSGGCKGCPDDYGYASYDHCVRNDKGNVDCALCWDQPVETGAIGHGTLYIDNRPFATVGSVPPKPDRKEKYKEAALEYKALFDALKDAGFDSSQAFLLTKTLVAKTVDDQEEK